LIIFTLLTPKETENAFQKSSIDSVLEGAIYRSGNHRTRGKSSDDSHASSESEDNSDSDYDDDCIDDIAADLATYTDCLMDLHTAYDNPASDEDCDRTEEIAAGEAFQPSRYYSDRIAIRFPEANRSLVDKLGVENWKRFLRCQYERDLNSQIQQENTNDTAADQNTVVLSKFHDSGLGSSVPATTLYAETVTSFYREDGEVVRIPSLPEEGKAGKPFECIVCNKKVLISLRASWK
jgi:hypothetical protein